MKIHFASLFCVDYDMDLAHEWVEHYRNFHFDKYVIWLHSPSSDIMLLNQAKRFFRIKGFEVFDAGEVEFRAGKLRECVLEAYRQTLSPDDYLVTADSDEFQKVDNYREKILSHDLVMGELIDRYDDTLHNALPGIPLEQQFPHTGIVEREVFRSVPFEVRVYWPYVNKEKILASRADLPVAFGGSHMLLYMNRDIRYSAYHEVRHFTWRGTILERMSRKGYYRGVHIWHIQKFFGIHDITDVLLRMEKEEEEIQKAKGWIPCPVN